MSEYRWRSQWKCRRLLRERWHAMQPLEQPRRQRKRRVRYRPELVMKLNHLKTELESWIPQREFARAVNVVPRTIRNWNKKKAPEDFKLGRPAHDERAHQIAFWKVGRE